MKFLAMVVTLVAIAAIAISGEALGQSSPMTEAHAASAKRIAEARAVQEEEEAKEALKRAAELPEKLKILPQLAFCAAYGAAIRNGDPDGQGFIEGADEMARKEARRRKVVFNEELTQKQRFRIGVSRCQLYASWGEPGDLNRTVTGRSEHIQHIYSGTYVYTVNGVLTSFQD